MKLEDYFILLLMIGCCVLIFWAGLFIGDDKGENRGERQAYAKLLGKQEGERFLRCHSKDGEMVNTSAGTVCLLKNKE